MRRKPREIRRRTMSRFKKLTATIVLVLVLLAVLSAGLTACNEETVSLTLDCNGGDLGGLSEYTLQLLPGVQADLSGYLPEKKGYVFAGWTDGNTMYSKYYVPTGNARLTAVWMQSDQATTLGALKTIVAALQNKGAFGFVFEGKGSDSDGKVTGVSLKANVTSEEIYTLGVEFADENEELQVGVYVMNGALYVYSPEMGGVVLEDFDINYILEVAARMPEVLGNLLGGLDIVGLSFDMILSTLFTMFTKTDVYVEGSDTVYNIQINPKGLQGIASLLNLINLDSILKGAGLDIKTSGLISWFKGVLPDMQINVNVAVDSVTGKVSGVTSDAVYEGEQYFEFSTTDAGFYDEGEVVPVAPSVLEGYQQISLGNIDLNVDLAVENDGADLGALLNAITGTQAIPAGALLLSSDLTYRLTLKTSLDIAQKTSGDENYIVLELAEINDDGSLTPFIGVYYKEGNLYVDLAKTLGGIYGGKGIKIGVDLKELVSQIKSVVTDAIDGVFFTEERALNGRSKLDKNGVVALSGNEGNYYVSGGVLNFIKVLVGVFGVDGDKVSVEDGTDENGNFSVLGFKVDQSFLSSFLKAIGVDASVPDFGSVNLGIKLNADGLDGLTVDAALNGGIDASIVCDDFSIGKSPEIEGYASLAEYIDAMVGDESKYTYSVKELVGSLLEGVSLDADLRLTLAAGNYNIMDIVSLFGIENDGGAAAPWTVNADSVMNAHLSAQLAVNPYSGALNASVILSLNEDFNIGNDKILPAGQLLAVYLSEDGTGYIDLTNVSLFGVALPALKAQIDLSSVIDGLMTTLDTDLVFDVSGLFGTSETEALSRLNADGQATPLNLWSQVTSEGAGIIVNSDSLKVNVTLATVSAILKAFGVQFDLPEGLQADLSASLDGEGLCVSANAALPGSGDYDSLGFGLALNVASGGVKTGVDGLSGEIEDLIADNVAGLADAQSNVINALLGTVGRLSITASVEVDADETKDLGAYIKQFVSKWLPDTDFDLNVESGKMQLLIALNSERGEYAVVLTEGESNVILSARVTGETIIVTVADFGSFILRDTGIISTIEGAVNEAVAGIENADLNTLFENLLNPSQDAGTEEPAPEDPTPEEPVPEQPETPSQGVAIDIISLLGGIRVDDAVINIDITREMIASIFSALGIEVDFVSAGGALDIVNGRVEVNANIGDGALTLGIGLEIGRTDDETMDYGFATDLLKAYGDEGFVADGQNDVEELRSYLVTGLKAVGEYRSYMQSWSLSALASEYTRFVQSDSVIVFTSKDDLKQYVTGLLEGISLEADLKLDFTPGEYNILEFIGKFVDLTTLGLPADASLIVSFGEPSVDLSIRFNSAIRPAEYGAEGVMALEIIANRPLSFGTTVGGGEGITVIPQGEALLAVYIRDGSLYIDVTALEVLGLNLPVFKVDNFDLPTFIYDNVEKLVAGLFAEEETGGNIEAQPLALSNGEGGVVGLTIARNRLQLSVTVSAIGAILSNFLTGDGAATAEDILNALGDVEVNVSLLRDDSQGSGVYTFALSLAGNLMTTTDGQLSDFSLGLSASTTDIKAGDETLFETFGAYVDEKISGYDKTYSDILRGIADNLFTGSMLIDVDVDFNEGKYYLNTLVNNILAAFTDTDGIEVPIAVDAGTFTKKLQIALQWNLDPDTKQLTLMVEIRSGKDVLIGLYMHEEQLVADLTGVGLISVKVSNISLIKELSDTLTTAIDSLQGLDLNELLGGLFGNSTLAARDGGEAETPTDGEGTTDAGDSGENAWIAQLLGVVMLENANVRLAMSVQLLQDIIYALAGKQIDLGSDLFDLSANLGILTGTISFDATLFGEGENALIGMSVDASLKNETIVTDSYIPAIFLRDHYEIDASDTGTLIADVIDNLGDIGFSLDLTVAFKAGTYNVAELLADLGVTALSGTQLLWEFTKDTEITLTLDVKLKMYSDDGTAGGRNGMASIEILAKDGIDFGSSNLAQPGSVLLGLYAYDDMTYLDASGLSLLGLEMPVFKVDYDLLGAVAKKLNAIADSSAEQTQTVAVYADETGETTVVAPLNDENGEIVIGISEGEIAVTAALSAVLAVLEDMNVDLGVDLSQFDVTAAIRVGNGLSVELAGVILPTTDGTENSMSIEIRIPSDALEIGIDVDTLGSYLQGKAQEYVDYNDDVIETIKNMLGKNSLHMQFTIDSQASQVDINSLVSGILNTLGVNLTIPLTLNFDELNYDLDVIFNWNMELRQLLLEINIIGSVNNKTLIGLYGDKEDLYVALGGVGLVDLHVAGSPLIPVLYNKLDDLLATIDPIIISDILAELLDGKNLNDEVLNVPVAGGDEFAAGTDVLASGGSDLIKYLLSSVKITDSKIVADITSEIMTQIIRSLGFEIDFVLEAGVGVDLAGDKIEAYVNLGSDSRIDLVVGLEGEADRYKPSDMSNFITIDAAAGANDGAQIVKEFIDGFDFAFSLDLMSAGVGNLVDSSRGISYTRVEIKKVSGVVQLENHSEKAGANDKSGILLSLFDINEAEYTSHGSGTKKAMMHFYLDYTDGTATVYLCPGWFVISVSALFGYQIDITTYLSKLSLQLDLLGMLKPTVESWIQQVNDAANGLGEEEQPPAEDNTPSQDEGTGEVTGIAKVLADLDIEALLRPGITLNLLSTGVTNLNVKFDPYEFNKLIDGVMGCLFGADTILDLTTLESNGKKLFSRNYLSRMWWDRVAGCNTSNAANGGTPYSTWDSILKDLKNILSDVLTAVNYGGLSGLFGAINWPITTGNFHEIFKRITSVPVFNEAEINVNLIEGTLANISFSGRDTGEAITGYELGQDGEWNDTGEILVQKVRSTYQISNTVDKDGAYYYTYKYAGSGAAAEYGGKGLLFRTGYSYYQAYNGGAGLDTSHGYHDYNKDYATLSYSAEIYVYNKSSSVGDSSYTLNGTDGAVDWGNLSANISFNPYLYSSDNGYQGAVDEYWQRYFSNYGVASYQKGTAVKRGNITLTYKGGNFDKSVLSTIMNTAGTHTIKATAKFNDGTTSTMNITFKVLNVNAGGSDCVRTVDPINLHVYESLPDYFTVTTYSGHKEKYYTDGKTVYLTGDYQATSPKGGVKTAYLTFANGKKYPVTVNYYDSTINDQTIEMSWYDLDFTGSDTQEGKDAAIRSLLDRFDVYYADGSFIPQAISDGATWDTSALQDLVVRSKGDLSAATVEVTVVFDKRLASDGVTLETVDPSLVQRIKLTLRMADKRKLSVVYDGYTEGNYLRVDPYAYYLYAVTGDERYNPIPSTVTATYSDASKENIYVSTIFEDDVDWSYMTEKTVTATLKIDGSRYDGNGYFDEDMKISVVINRNVIEAIYFDEAKTQDYIVGGEKYETATVVFSNGLELVLPVAIVENGDSADVYIGFDVDVYETYGKIAAFNAINGTLLQAFTVQIR